MSLLYPLFAYQFENTGPSDPLSASIQQVFHTTDDHSTFAVIGGDKLAAIKIAGASEKLFFYDVAEPLGGISQTGELDSPDLIGLDSLISDGGNNLCYTELSGAALYGLVEASDTANATITNCGSVSSLGYQPDYFDGHFFVANTGSDTLLKIPANNCVGTVSLQSSLLDAILVVAVEKEAGVAWCAMSNSSTLRCVDIDSMTIVDSLTIPGVTSILSMRVTPSHVYLTDAADGLVIFDREVGSIVFTDTLSGFDVYNIQIHRGFIYYATRKFLYVRQLSNLNNINVIEISASTDGNSTREFTIGFGKQCLFCSSTDGNIKVIA